MFNNNESPNKNLYSKKNINTYEKKNYTLAYIN